MSQPKRVVIESLRAGRWPQGARSSSFRFIDLFAGIGAFRLGFESIGGQCVFTSEWDKSCQQTYRRNFVTDHEVQGDITQVDAASIPTFDVLLAGFPCRPFSIAGYRRRTLLAGNTGSKMCARATCFSTSTGCSRPTARQLSSLRTSVTSSVTILASHSR